jgi:hypothetical protein
VPAETGMRAERVSPGFGSTRATEDAAPRRADGSLVLNPLRSEGEAFRFLLYVLAVFVTIIVVIVVVRALT